jgi:Mn2+/Fe2+ NRAMP family transporter
MPVAEVPHSGAAKKYDPYELSPDAVLEPPRTFGQILSKIGPGMILAGAIVGTGELIATTNLGARAGFALLWLVLLSCFIKVFVQI